MRDNAYLQSRLGQLWEKYFSEIPASNKVHIKFGRTSKYRFGSIRLHHQDRSSHILINGMFKDPSFPKEVIDHTIAHEMVHYAQGFSSTRPRLHAYPHRGGVINSELNERGLKHLVFVYKIWLEQYKRSIGILD